MAGQESAWSDAARWQPPRLASAMGAAGCSQRQLWRRGLGSLPDGKRLTGNSGSGSAGPSVPAGGLVFVGATSDRRLGTFAMKTGAELRSVRLPGRSMRTR
jgi:glucose dehydrogenase